MTPTTSIVECAPFVCRVFWYRLFASSFLKQQHEWCLLRERGAGLTAVYIGCVGDGDNTSFSEHSAHTVMSSTPTGKQAPTPCHMYERSKEIIHQFIFKNKIDESVAHKIDPSIHLQKNLFDV